MVSGIVSEERNKLVCHAYCCISTYLQCSTLSTGVAGRVVQPSMQLLCFWFIIQKASYIQLRTATGIHANFMMSFVYAIAIYIYNGAKSMHIYIGSYNHVLQASWLVVCSMIGVQLLSSSSDSKCHQDKGRKCHNLHLQCCMW